MDSETYNAVIEKATGNLLRMGYVDFERGMEFDSDNETGLEDLPNLDLESFESGLMCYRFAEVGDEFSRWDGSKFVNETKV